MVIAWDYGSERIRAKKSKFLPLWSCRPLWFGEWMGHVLPIEDAGRVRERLGLKAGQRLVFTNGCFDILHAGHVRYLRGARALGDALVVGLNGDGSVRKLKGPDRPVNSEDDRAEVLAALESVDAVVIFPDVRATALIEAVRPEIYAKGGDYTEDSLNSEERSALRAAGTEIHFLPLVPGRSTTETVAKLTRVK